MKINDFMLSQLQEATHSQVFTVERYAELNPEQSNDRWVELSHPHVVFVAEEEYEYTVVDDSGHGWFFLFKGETLLGSAPSGVHTMTAPDVVVLDRQYFGTDQWLFFSAAFKPHASAEEVWEDLVARSGHDLNTVVQFTKLLREGGTWLGAARSWIQRHALNGDSVVWGSDSFLKLRPITVSDVEMLAAEIAASTINEMNSTIRHKGIIGYISETKVRELVKATRRHAAIAALYQQAVNQIDDYFEYTAESARDKSKIMGIINVLTSGLKKLKK